MTGLSDDPVPLEPTLECKNSGETHGFRAKRITQFNHRNCTEESMSAPKRTVPATKKAAPKKGPVMKEAAKKTPAKKAPALKEAAKRVPAKKAAHKKASTTNSKPFAVGILFPDPGFHIAVLGALLEMQTISTEDVQVTLEGLEFDDDTSETDRLLAAMARLHVLKLDPKDLARIESLDFDGGNEIYMLLEDGAGTETGGEDDTYGLLAITGIAALSSLKTLNLDGHGYREETLDLKPLEGHPALETLRLTGKCTPAKTLETLPNLAKLDLQYADVGAPTVIDRLAKRGVTIVKRT
jgi:hypothetical protein